MSSGLDSGQGEGGDGKECRAIGIAIGVQVARSVT